MSPHFFLMLCELLRDYPESAEISDEFMGKLRSDEALRTRTAEAIQVTSGDLMDWLETSDEYAAECADAVA